MWGFGMEREDCGTLLDRGRLSFRRGLSVAYKGDGSTVGNVTNVEIVSTPGSQRSFCRPGAIKNESLFIYLQNVPTLGI